MLPLTNRQNKKTFLSYVMFTLKPIKVTDTAILNNQNPL